MFLNIFFFILDGFLDKKIFNLGNSIRVIKLGIECDIRNIKKYVIITKKTFSYLSLNYYKLRKNG